MSDWIIALLAYLLGSAITFLLSRSGYRGLISKLGDKIGGFAGVISHLSECLSGIAKMFDGISDVLNEDMAAEERIRVIKEIIEESSDTYLEFIELIDKIKEMKD